MSTCISAHGEFSSHTPDDAHTCTLCGVLDEEGLIAELRQLREALMAAEAERDTLREQLDDARALTACEVGEYERLLADRDAMRVVVEEARAWRASLNFANGDDRSGYSPEEYALGDAVDIYDLPLPTCPVCGEQTTGFASEPTATDASRGFVEVIAYATKYQPCGHVVRKMVGSEETP